MVRVTTQSLKEVESLRKIRQILNEKKYTQPLVADVHFQPKVALEAAKIVEKVRINPGNYIPGKYEGPKTFDFNEQENQIGRIREKLLPLIQTCKKYDTAIRIGVNHGSLSERILNWYGNTPGGMVESALEFLQIFQQENFTKIVVSLKSSSSRVMIYANRLLVKRMGELGFRYPIHLGVTEAGDEEEGRIKSAAGICSLLSDGIGDTLRISLTEEPEEEIPVALEMVNLFPEKMNPAKFAIDSSSGHDPFRYGKRISQAVHDTGGENVPVVINSLKSGSKLENCSEELGYSLNPDLTLKASPTASDYVFSEEKEYLSPGKFGIQLLSPHQEILKNHYENVFPLVPFEIFKEIDKNHEFPVFVKITAAQAAEGPAVLKKLLPSAIIIFNPGNVNSVQIARDFFKKLAVENSKVPVILHRKYSSENLDKLIIRAAAELGSLLIDGYGDGIWIEEENPEISVGEIRDISFNILQACSARISKTEYISCPSCGRTLFNIQSTLKKVKQATAGFTGLKIAVMGCIVNGPGEMADADFGYVGAGPGRVSLYKGHVEVIKNIPEERAVEELLKLIRNEQ
jgi:(E)-4-hydroxy-3-methylbut-2-enyl-diphosphate synthase